MNCAGGIISVSRMNWFVSSRWLVIWLKSIFRGASFFNNIRKYFLGNSKKFYIKNFISYSNGIVGE